jgi:hypothetical protein
MAAAPAPVVASPAVPSPGSSASEHTTSATEPCPAPSASHAPMTASIPACGDPLSSAPPTSVRRPKVAHRKEKLGPSAKGGRAVPHHSPDTSFGVTPAASSAPRAAAHARVKVSSSASHTATVARPPPEPHAAPTSAAARRSDGAAAPRPRTATGFTALFSALFM